MKKLTTYIVLAALCLNFSARSQDKPAAITALKIGDQVPDITINNIINYKGADGKPATTAKISDFRGRLLILDFWATWCSPCVAMIPKMDSLQKKFTGRVALLPVTNQPHKVVTDFLTKLHRLTHFNLPDVLEDSVLNSLFPHSYLPHYVWINPAGIVIAITEYKEINKANIQASLSGSPVKMSQKSDVLLKDTNGIAYSGMNKNEGCDKIFHHLTPGYQEDMPSKYQIFDEDKTGKRILVTNLIMPNLFNIALGGGSVYYGKNRTVFEVKDTAALISHVKGEEAIQWMKQGHVYSYEIKVPPGMGTLAFQIMQQDLINYFKQYEVTIESRQTKCLALVRTDTIDRLATKGAKSEVTFDGISCHMVNFSLSRFIAQLNYVYMQNSLRPIIDKTNYNGRIDLEINARLSDLKAVNLELVKYGLHLQETTQPLDMMVIRDRKY